MDGPYEGEQVEEIKLTLPALVGYARVARLAVTGLASRMGFSYDEIEDLRIAVGEVCGILLDDGPGRITIRCTLGQDTLALEAIRRPIGTVPRATDLTRQILHAVVDQTELDLPDARVLVTKRRRD